MKLFRILDPFTLTLIGVVLLASFFPAQKVTTAIRISILFYTTGRSSGYWRAFVRGTWILGLLLIPAR